MRAPLDVTFAALLDRVGHQERAGDFEKRRPLYRSHVTPEVAVIVRTHGAIFSLATARASYVSSGWSYTHARKEPRRFAEGEALSSEFDRSTQRAWT